MSTDNILVAIKSRPLISRETSEKLQPQWTVQDKTIFQIDDDGHRLSEPYSFDHIFTEYMSNANVYDAVVESLVKSFLNGFNSTIFAYGQTSSGKTHTMMGTDNIPGIIQLAISDVFHHVSQDDHRRYLISCSYFEIYNEKINDLLDKNGKDLKIREDFCGNTFVNAKEEVVIKATQVYELMKIGGKIRKIGCTNINDRSSRSHTIFRLTIKSTENNIENGPVQISYLNLVDLAGSERIAHTKAAGVRLKEGVNINKSLLALGNVIRQLSEGEGYINYRDSNLTRLLQHALGGNAKSLIIATITIAAGEETKSTLEFAQRAKVVKNKPIINEILSEQDKLKQYELVTAAYEDRLEKEKQRIQEMEQEKAEREREILKLKQQVKLVDLFTNGPQEVKTTENKIARRHTMGYYTARIPLQTISESRVLPLNVIQETYVENGTKCDLNEEELFLKRASEISDYDFMKIVIEESLDDGILSATPEPSEELLLQEETTPASQLRERLKHLEESYMSLKEFTKLEAQCKEDKDIVLNLLKEKDNLLKDLMDMNIIVKDMRQDKEQMKMKFEEELSALKNDLEYVKKKSDNFSFALKQAEAEKDALRLTKEQQLNDNVVLLEHQRLKYENQLEYLITEIETVNKQIKENQKIDNRFEEEMQRLRKENEDFKSNNEKITIYEEKIMQLEGKLQKFQEEEDCNILRITHTEAITLEAKEMVNIELNYINKTIMQKEYEELKEKIQKLNDKLEEMQSLNLALEDELRECKEKNSSFLEIEIADSNMKNHIAQKQEEIDVLSTKIRNLEKEIPLRDDQIIDLKSKLDAVQIEQSENVADLVLYKDEIKLKINEITALQNKLDKLEKDNENYKQEIDVLKQEVISKEKIRLTAATTCTEVEKDLKEKIKKLKQKIEYLSNKNDSLELDIQGFTSQLNNCRQNKEERDNEIVMLTEQIEKMRTKGQEDCKKCPQRQHHIKKLEELNNQNTFKIVSLQTQIYDLQNTYQQEKANTEERERRLHYDIRELETRLGDSPLPELKDAEIQCDLTNIEQLLDKYRKTKKLARMRRDEGNILRARLGMNADEQIT